jgi:ferric-dicitrate binding protein FerR (iron transport regulator)
MSDERHNGIGPEEERVRDTLRSVDDVRARAAFRERLKREFVEGTIGEREPARFGLPRWSWLLLPAAAMLVIAFLMVPQGPEGWVAVDADASFESGQTLQVEPGSRMAVRLDRTLLLELDEGADVTLPADEGDPLVAEVRAGELRIKTGPDFPGREFHILTPESRTEIVGTMVSVFKGDGLTCVCVLEGTAQIGAGEGDLEPIPAGKRKVMFADGRPSMITDIMAEHAEGLEAFIERHRHAFE